MKGGNERNHASDGGKDGWTNYGGEADVYVCRVEGMAPKATRQEAVVHVAAARATLALHTNRKMVAERGAGRGEGKTRNCRETERRFFAIDKKKKTATGRGVGRIRGRDLLSSTHFPRWTAAKSAKWGKVGRFYLAIAKYGGKKIKKAMERGRKEMA